MTLSQIADKLLNWKKNPASVFFFALPLFAIGMGLLLLLRAILEIKLHGDWVFLMIVFFGIGLLAFALWPIRKQIAQSLGIRAKR